MGKDNERRVNIDRDVKEFAKITFKKFKKENKDDYSSKKELKKMFYIYLIDLLPEVINFCVRYGHIKTEEVQEVKDGCFRKLTDPTFLKYLKKTIKKEGSEIHNIKLFPIIASEIFNSVNALNKQALASDPKANQYDLGPLADVVKVILKKKIKRFRKNEIDEDIAFDVCCIIPTERALLDHQNYRIKQLYEALYEMAKGRAVPFKAIINALIKEKSYLPAFVVFALLERKDKYSNLTDSQKTLYVDITNWALTTLESFDRDFIYKSLQTYVGQRKRAESQGHDSRRRYDLQTLSEVDYPKIVKVINRMISDDDSVKKYL